MKIAVAAVAAIIAVPILIGGVGQAVVKALFGSSTQPSQAALADIPADYLTLYRQATSVCPGLDWSILAAIGKVETNHGRSPLPGVSSGENYAGAGGPMQFLQSTFDGVIARHPLPAGGATPPSRYNPHDAIYAAAYYLCDSGAPKDLRKAIFAYNHADWYVDEVLAQAKKYNDALIGTGDCNNIQAPTPAAIMAINFACGQLGLPYVWGGNGPADGHAGFDCSGLTSAAYNAAGIKLPRTAQTQYNAGPLVPAGQPLLPGDLVFYGTPGNVHHVGLYIGAGKMVHAPTFGQPVQVSSYRWNGDDYLAASRPTGDARV
ncbi:bifunctional lytic transglycosylase/C40 family peptidase [Lentzea sp. BCCO 10_0856]|uniref:Bifunctional lytic transglycosylase/C40 family peptidase n=1 Tax=Lentzea miocenica TaxID=3095431 RepID=A0ABU4SYW1_9PSEU|nr:bifunctional lytic transglycosylase/C40 family peptidase [Lentzea sp. BCCO 10_0856]MDX8030999.1 bifunctional lytic transglycosylase/C40 family peptidase [Lentzea sp. BCCO 10_0856]